MMKKVRSMDMSFIVVLLMFAIFGLIMVYSSSYSLGSRMYENHEYFYRKQKTWFLTGGVLFVAAALIPIRWLKRWSPFLVLISFILLLLVLVPGIGVERNHSQRWLAVGGMLFQPTEMIKLFMLIYFAFIYAKKQSYIDKFKEGVFPPLIILGAVFLLILQQPDLGSASLILLSCGVIVLAAGVRKRHLFMLVSIAGIGMASFALSSPYRVKRLTSYLNPFDDPTGDGFQLLHGYMAIASGGLNGNGLGSGTQKLGYLPEAHTDFIMAVIIEELGIIGVAIVIGTYLYIMLKGVKIAHQTQTVFGKLLALGLTFQLLIQAVFNLGAVSGLLPITGITLPFVSYGGSSLVVTFISAGLLINLSSVPNRKIVQSSIKKPEAAKKKKDRFKKGIRGKDVERT
ncbi:cell division protein FtsW [Halobacillus karajensis]|uniref:putative lipid II flippase FtsW n=1 Tax=Halobacillus karajensis TaxID=195088 RepID=UPI0008A7F419|nr:putative lipid II flippase FtsW [Halobacillus karajensis]SEH98133.1 cell division protein FtsW [Halobacillus karajensis]